MDVNTASPDIDKPRNQTGKRVKVVNVDSNSYQLDEKALARILLRDDVKDLPVVVVSVAGPVRAGKSFLLNFFLRYLTAPEEARNESGKWLGGESEPLTGFTWRVFERHTTAIHMWSEPFTATLPSGEKVAVLLMDTQGTFDCSTIFALSTLVSSVQIYNIKDNIKEDDLQHLQFFTEYGKLSKNEDGKKPFQVLEFLVRDWQYDYEHAYGHKGGEELLAIRMEETPDMPPETRELRQQIRSYFEKLTCFLMPYPGFAVTKRNFSGSLSELEDDFKDALKELVPSIFASANLTPKLINGEIVKARDLFTYFKTYMIIFNSDVMPSPNSIAKATEIAALLSAVEEVRDLYKMRMARVTSPAQPSLTALALDDEHKKALAAARTAFIDKKLVAKKESDVADMIHELEKELPFYKSVNDAKIRKIINEARDGYENTIRQVYDQNKLCLHPLKLEVVHNEALQAALAHFDAQRKGIPDIPDTERIKFVEALTAQFIHIKTIHWSKTRKQFQRALDFYTNYMTMLWDPDTCCLHPDDLLQAHKTAKDQAVRLFTLNEHTEDGDLNNVYLTQILDITYFQAKDRNGAFNSMAVEAAYNKYLAVMGEKCQVKWWWLLIIPIAIDSAQLSRYHLESKEAALVEFYSRRRDTKNTAPDRFLDRLYEKINAAYARF